MFMCIKISYYVPPYCYAHARRYDSPGAGFSNALRRLISLRRLNLRPAILHAHTQSKGPATLVRVKAP